MPTRNLVIVLGDQLNANSAVFDGFDPERDVVWMAEVAEESTHVWTHKARIVLFLSAMRHFRDSLQQQGFQTDYRCLADGEHVSTLDGELHRSIQEHSPKQLIVVQPGAHRVQQLLLDVAKRAKIPIDVRIDRHFFTTAEDFADHAEGRKQLRLEYFYRELRRKQNVLMDGKDPLGGKWNFDKSNRGTFGRKGPEDVPKPKSFPPDEMTLQVIELVEERFGDHPGDLSEFDWPVTPRDARKALEDFIEYRLPSFGEYQDAMWTDEPFLYHSLISAAMNLKLIDPREVIAVPKQLSMTIVRH